MAETRSKLPVRETGRRARSAPPRTAIRVPPRRCAALLKVNVQCPHNVVEPTDYCARHADQAAR